MRHLAIGRRTAAFVACGALLLSGCAGDGAEVVDGPSDVASPSATSDATATDVGVTDDACPAAVNAANGCIYLGTLSDLTQGPFAALAIEVMAGQEAFWARVNAAGGIGGYDVNVTEYVRDNKYDAGEHVAQFLQIEPNILALAQSLGTPPTLAALDMMKEMDVVGVPATWWSGWAFEDVMMDSGASYCVAAMNILDYANTTWVADGVDSILVVGYAGAYGADAAAGVQIWADANEVDFNPARDVLEAVPYTTAGNQDPVVTSIVRSAPSVVYLATGPLEAAEIIRDAMAGGYEGRFVGAAPTFNPALMADEGLAALLETRYRQVGPWGPWGTESAAHTAMATAVGSDLPASDGFTYGWVWQYPMKAAIEQAIADGNLTRTGMREAAARMTVDYEGALPNRTYDGGATAVKQVVISGPDREAPLGLAVAVSGYTGETAAGFTLTAPCGAAG